MSVNYTDFDKIWASTSPLTPYEFSESQYKEGWNFVGNTPPSRQMWDKFMQQADEKMKYLYNHESVPVGHEYFTFNPNIPQGSLPLFGGEYSRETYSALWNWVQEQTGYLKTEAEWQTLSTANNGNVPFYSDGDGSTTFRVPSLKCWIKAANGTVSEVGSYLAAGLPNITGSIDVITANYNSVSLAVGNGAFSTGDLVSIYKNQGQNEIVQGRKQLLLNASNSNSIYGNSTTVQPPSIVGMWLVKAYGVVEDTGTIDEQQYIDDRIAALPTSLATTFLPLTGGTMTGAIIGSGSFITNSVDNVYTHINGGTSQNNGAWLRLTGKDNTGTFQLSANNGANSLALVGSPNGTLTWNSKEVERVNASGTGYIRYESGLQICWGVETKSVTLTQVLSTGIYYAAVFIALPVSFKNTNYTVSATSRYSTGNALASGLSETSTTAITIHVYDFYARTGDMKIWWHAIGWWK